MSVTPCCGEMDMSLTMTNSSGAIFCGDSHDSLDWLMTCQSYLMMMVGLFHHERETAWLAMDIPDVGEEWLVALFKQLLFSGIYGTTTRTLIEVNLHVHLI